MRLITERSMSKTLHYGKQFLMFVFIATCLQPGHAKSNTSFYIIGPSFSKHLQTSYNSFREFHPGIGLEFQWKKKLWILGWHGYYMHKDSLNHKSFWTGLTLGLEVGKKRKFWFSPFIIVGGITKKEYHEGKFSFFGLPVISAGYNRFGINLGFIPRIPNVTDPLFILQFKYRI